MKILGKLIVINFLLILSFAPVHPALSQPLIYSKKVFLVIEDVEKEEIINSVTAEDEPIRGVEKPAFLQEKIIAKFTVEIRPQGFLESDIITGSAMENDMGIMINLDEAKKLSVPMQNIFSARDLIFIDTDNRISEIISRVSAENSSYIESQGVVSRLLELNGGSAEAHGIKVGNLIKAEEE